MPSYEQYCVECGYPSRKPHYCLGDTPKPKHPRPKTQEDQLISLKSSLEELKLLTERPKAATYNPLTYSSLTNNSLDNSSLTYSSLLDSPLTNNPRDISIDGTTISFSYDYYPRFPAQIVTYNNPIDPPINESINESIDGSIDGSLGSGASPPPPDSHWALSAFNRVRQRLGLRTLSFSLASAAGNSVLGNGESENEE